MGRRRVASGSPRNRHPHDPLRKLARQDGVNKYVQLRRNGGDNTRSIVGRLLGDSWSHVNENQSSHHPQEVLLAQFSLYVHKGGLKPDSFHFFVNEKADDRGGSATGARRGVSGSSKCLV